METGAEVVLRELEEEMGEKEAKVLRPLWFAEYFFEFGGKIQHQYILGYLVDIPDDSKLIKENEFAGIEEEKNIIYKWIDIKDIKSSPIKPDFLKSKLTDIKEYYEFITEKQI